MKFAVWWLQMQAQTELTAYMNRQESMRKDETSSAVRPHQGSRARSKKEIQAEHERTPHS